MLISNLRYEWDKAIRYMWSKFVLYFIKSKDLNNNNTKYGGISYEISYFGPMLIDPAFRQYSYFWVKYGTEYLSPRHEKWVFKYSSSKYVFNLWLIDKRLLTNMVISRVLHGWPFDRSMVNQKNLLSTFYTTFSVKL